MPDERIFTYQTEGLSYSVTVSQGQDGKFYADITVIEGSADVNAVYWGDEDASGPSASLPGPLNMNGGGASYLGEDVQWDGALALSRPGLGKAGTGKETFLQAGDTLRVELPIDNLEDVDFFGIRATSTSTPGGSIKAVSGDPETPDDPDDPDDPCGLQFEKVFFGSGSDGEGGPLGGHYILASEPEGNPYNVAALPEGTEPNFANFVSYFEQIGGDIGSISTVVFFGTDENGALVETHRIDAPEGGFADAQALIDAYDAMIATADAQDAGEGLLDFFNTGSIPEEEPGLEGEPEGFDALYG